VEAQRLLQLIVAQGLLPMLAYLGLGVPFALLEWRFPRMPIPLRRRVLRDLGSLAVVCLYGIVIPVVVFQGVVLPLRLGMLFPTAGWPWWVSVPLAALGIDFSFYWVHRALHSRWLWTIHRWHHAATDLYWLAGIRASLPQNLLYVLMSVVWGVALHVPLELFGLGAVGGALGNHFMHTNLGFAWPGLERFVITPRVHRVHHHETPRSTNFGAFLSVWDHLFGTWEAPDGQTPKVGIAEQVHPLRLVLGL
jgi:sterol desaturase/sphingolipid hydroxylase (fatty acid hydroxylase superfamily)